MCRLKKRWFYLISFLVLCLIVIPVFRVKAAEDEVNGSEYIEVRTVEDLYSIRYNMEGRYRLVNDIDLDGQEWIPIGENGSLESVLPFTGVFDGCGYTIKGLRISIDNEALNSYGYDYVGLFAWNKGSIYNVKFSSLNIHFVSERDAGGIYVGCVAGVNDGIISNVSILDGSIWGELTGSVSDQSDVYKSVEAFVASVSGYSSGLIEKCTNMATVSANSNYQNGESKKMQINMAGITCGTNEAIIRECGNRGRVWDSKYSGGPKKTSYGISINGTVTDSYNTAETDYGIINSGNTVNCYFTGFALMNANATNCFYGPYKADREPSGWSCLYYPEMKKASSYVGFDFNNTWEFNSDSDYEYPVLKKCDYLTPMSIPNDENSIEELKVTSNKLYYVEGERIERTDLTVKAVYNNGTETEIKNYLIEDVDTEFDKKAVRIKYNNTIAVFEPYYVKKPPVCLKVTQLPDKTVYYDYEVFDNTGMIVEVVYNDDTSEAVDDYETGNFDILANSYCVKISWNGMSTTVPITLRRLVKSIKFDCNEKNLIEGRQGTISVRYSPSDAYNKSLVWVSSDSSVASVDSAGKITAIKEGTAVITAYLSSDEEITSSCSVNVISNTATSIEVTKEPLKTAYIEGSPFCPDGLEVMAVRKDGSKYRITDYSIDSVDTTPGKKTVRVRYGSLYDDFTVEYSEKKLTSIEIIKKPEKLVYTLGEKFDSSGMKVQAVYNNTLAEEIYDYEVADIVDYGNVDIAISYNEMIAYVQITVLNPIKYITIGTDRLSLVEGQQKQLNVTISPDDADNKELVWKSSDSSVVSVNDDGIITAKKKGAAFISVSAANDSRVFSKCEVCVEEKTVTKLIIAKKPTKLKYIEGESFDPAGLVIKAEYNNGKTEVINNYKLSACSTKPGTNKVLVSYEGCSVSFSVTYTKKVPEYMQDLKTITFGKSYNNTWSESNLRNYKFSISKNGVITIKATKPNKPGYTGYNYAPLVFTIRDSNGKEIFTNESYKAADEYKQYYVVDVGLKKGTYYLGIKPGSYFYYGGNTISSKVTVSYGQNSYAEIEPNDSKQTATPIIPGEIYTGYFGSDGVSNSENTDYWYVDLIKGRSYSFSVADHNTYISNTCTQIDLISPTNKYYNMSSYLKKSKNNTVSFEAEETGRYYISFGLYFLKQYEYTMRIIDVSPNPPTSVLKLSISCTGTVTYTGAKIAPAVKVNDGSKVLKKGIDYTVSYSNNVNVGTATIKIRGKGKYNGTVTKTFSIIPKGTTIKKLNSGTSAFTASWNPQKTKMKTSNITGYQIQYSNSKTFASGNKIVSAAKYSTTTKTVKNLVKGKTYYVRIRTYKTVGGVKYFSTWSDAKTVKVK